MSKAHTYTFKTLIREHFSMEYYHLDLLFGHRRLEVTLCQCRAGKRPYKQRT